MIASAPFIHQLREAQLLSGSSLCLGLDPEPALLPEQLRGMDGIEAFCSEAIEATSDLVCAYKPNLAFFERYGSDGWRLLERLLPRIPSAIPVIVDGKRGDIGNTSRAYAEAVYERLGAAACTASPYLGVEAIEPLLDHPSGFAFILCRTSNPGAGTLQDALVDGEPLHARVIREFLTWIGAERAGLVIGAQEAPAFARAAAISPEAILLVPGIGAQGGTVQALAAALAPFQRSRVVVSASRSVLHAGTGGDLAAASREAALRVRDELRAALLAPALWRGDVEGPHERAG